MERFNLEQQKNSAEAFPKVHIVPEITFDSKISPIFGADITDAENSEKIGHVDFQLNYKQKVFMVQSVVIEKPKQGYGVALYRHLQTMYPEFQLVSSSQMIAKADESQEKPNAIYLWEKLVQLGDAEKDENGVYRMKRR